MRSGEQILMKGLGLLRARKRRHRETPDDEAFTPRERRSYEVTHVHGLWHLDFHDGSRPVFDASGTKRTPQLLGVLDERDHRGPRAPRRRASHDAAVLARAKREAGVVLGPDRGTPPGDARGRAPPHARSPQYRHPGLGRAGIPTQGALGDRRVAPRALSPRPQRRPRIARLRHLATRLPHGGLATMPIPAFTIPIPAFTMRRSWRSR